jgi:hypothetical protein
VTIPISRQLGDRHPEPGDQEQLADFFRNLIPFLHELRALANESNTLTEAAHADGYAWDLERFGSLFIEQTSGTCAMSVDSTVTLARLRQGRRYSLVIWNNSGGNIAVTFTSDFDATAVAVLATGDTASWDLIVKDSAFGPTGTLMEV